MITVVTGMPRSGTTLMMYMLQAGGMEVHADIMPGMECHGATLLPNDSYWLTFVDGKAIKILHPARFSPPSGLAYRFIWMDREIKQQMASQQKYRQNNDIPMLADQAAHNYIVNGSKAGKNLCKSLGDLRVAKFEDVLKGEIGWIADWMNLDADKMRQVIHDREPENYEGMMEEEIY